MRSRAELLLRVLGVAAMAAWIALALVPRASRSSVVSVDALEKEVARWTKAGVTSDLHVRMDSFPDASTAAWLAALRRSGARVTWEGEALPFALEAFRAVSPRRDLVILASGAGASAELRDDLGVLDSVAGAGVVRLGSAEGSLVLADPENRARTTVPTTDGAPPRAIFVAGAAGWEAKFIIAALEETGWAVHARLFVAPGKDVVQGSVAALDTARHAAVILLDSVAAESLRGVERFVRTGGGVVLAGTASRAPRVAPLTAWRAGTREAAALGTLPGDTAWRGLSRIPLTMVANRDAVALERRGDAAVVMVRRHHAGRVIAVGYDETWRWRMAGGGNSDRDHREWWSRIVSAVAARPYAPTVAPTGSAPVAALHELLGAPSTAIADGPGRFPRRTLANMLAVLALAALLAEWVLRRARGAR